MVPGGCSVSEAPAGVEYQQRCPGTLFPLAPLGKASFFEWKSLIERGLEPEQVVFGQAGLEKPFPLQ